MLLLNGFMFCFCICSLFVLALFCPGGLFNNGGLLVLFWDVGGRFGKSDFGWFVFCLSNLTFLPTRVDPGIVDI